MTPALVSAVITMGFSAVAALALYFAGVAIF
jgi:hypothetical protein